MTMDVLEQSFQLYRKAFWPCLPLSLCIAIGIYAPFLFFEHSSTSDLFIRIFKLNDPTSIGVWLLWFLTFLASCSLIVKINSIHINNELSTQKSIKNTLQEFLPLIFIAFLYALMITCGILLLVIPGLILSISLMFAFYIRLIEHQDVFDALSQSHRLVWGHWWYTALVMSVPFLMNLCLFLAIYVSVMGIMTNFTATWEHATFFSIFLNTILQVIFIPFIIGTALCLFYDLKTKKSKT